MHAHAEEHVGAERREVDLDPVQSLVLGDGVAVAQRRDEAVLLGELEPRSPDSQWRAEAEDDRHLGLRDLASPHHLPVGLVEVPAVSMDDAVQARIGPALDALQAAELRLVPDDARFHAPQCSAAASARNPPRMSGSPRRKLGCVAHLGDRDSHVELHDHE